MAIYVVSVVSRNWFHFTKKMFNNCYSRKTSTFMCIQFFFLSFSNNSIKHVNWMRNERAKHLAILCAQT